MDTNLPIYPILSVYLTRKEVFNVLNVLVLNNNKLEEKEIGNALEELQNIVGGYIEIPFISQKFTDNGIDMIINEEGKYIEELKPEIAVINKATNQILDFIYGSCVFASHNKEGDTIGLNDSQIEIIMEELKTNISLTYNDNGKEIVVKALFV